MSWDDGLDGAPKRIAGTDAHSLRVLAGPGTGKTFALMRRVTRLLESGTSPNDLIVCTFTRTAAHDLQESLLRLEVPGVDRVKAGTIHGYCFSLLSKGDVFDITGRVPRPLLDVEERFLLEDLVGVNNEGIRKLEKRLAAFSAAWARLQSDTPGWPRNAKDREFLQHLLPWLRFHNAILVGELVPETLKFLRTNPESPYYPKFRHVLIDEYQDLNKAEQTLLDLIAVNAAVTVVGDEDQSIYSFKHAHPEGIVTFSDAHPGTQDESLTECRRCPRRVVEMANDLIVNNRTRTRRVLTARPTNPPGEVFSVQWPDIPTEAEGLSSFIKRRLEAHAVEPGGILVLSPRRQFGYAIRDALNGIGIPAHSFFHEEVLEGDPKTDGKYAAQEAFEHLTLLARPTDVVALRCWIGFGSSTLRKGGWARLRKYCESTAQAPQTVLSQLSTGQLRIPYTSSLIDRYNMLVAARERFEGRHGSELVDILFPETEAWASPIRELARSLGPEEGPSELLDILQRNITQPELPVDVDYVRVMSLHKCKGLTAQLVIVCGLIDGLIPTVKYDLPAEEQRVRTEEQRRLFYVALTRTTSTLILSSVAEMDGSLAHRIGASFRTAGTVIQTLTSPFVNELGPSCPATISGGDLP